MGFYEDQRKVENFKKLKDKYEIVENTLDKVTYNEYSNNNEMEYSYVSGVIHGKKFNNYDNNDYNYCSYSNKHYNHFSYVFDDLPADFQSYLAKEIEKAKIRYLQKIELEMKEIYPNEVTMYTDDFDKNGELIRRYIES